MNAKVINVDIDATAGRDAIAAKIGKAVIDAIASGKKEKSEAVKTVDCDTDDMDDEALKALTDSDEYKRYIDELKLRTDALQTLIDEHQTKYNCAVVIGLIPVCGRDTHGMQVLLSGRGDSVAYAARHIAGNKEVSRLVQMRKIQDLIEDIKSGNADDQEGSDESDEAPTETHD